MDRVVDFDRWDFGLVIVWQRTTRERRRARLFLFLVDIKNVAKPLIIGGHVVVE